MRMPDKMGSRNQLCHKQNGSCWGGKRQAGSAGTSPRQQRRRQNRPPTYPRSHRPPLVMNRGYSSHSSSRAWVVNAFVPSCVSLSSSARGTGSQPRPHSAAAAAVTAAAGGSSARQQQDRRNGVHASVQTGGCKLSQLAGAGARASKIEDRRSMRRSWLRVPVSPRRDSSSLAGSKCVGIGAQHGSAGGGGGNRAQPNSSLHSPGACIWVKCAKCIVILMKWKNIVGKIWGRVNNRQVRSAGPCEQLQRCLNCNVCSSRGRYRNGIVNGQEMDVSKGVGGHRRVGRDGYINAVNASACPPAA